MVQSWGMALEQHVDIPTDGPVVDPELPHRRLALVAEAAERLLAAEDPARMVDELFALVQSELRLDVFFNYRLEGSRLVLEAHGGLAPEEATAGAALELGQAVCGCAARDRQRFHMTGVQRSDDPLVAFVRQVGLDAYACTPLLHGDTLIGTLGFGRRWADRFTNDELSFLHTLCHFVELAKYRLMVERELRRGLEQRDRLLAELNHRVRNALQLAVSVVRLEAASAKDEASSNALARAVDRIEVIASAHRPIYASDDFSTVNIFDLLGAVEEGARGRKLRVVGAKDAKLPIEQGVALALLVHTLFTESLASNDPVIVEVVREIGETWTGVKLIGLQSLPEVLSRRFSQALLRQLRAVAEHTTNELLIRVQATPND
jgi:two-component sensor histidine kinase